MIECRRCGVAVSAPSRRTKLCTACATQRKKENNRAASARVSDRKYWSPDRVRERQQRRQERHDEAIAREARGPYTVADELAELVRAQELDMRYGHRVRSTSLDVSWFDEPPRTESLEDTYWSERNS